MMHRLKLHKVLIQSLSFSFDEKYLASLGGALLAYLLLARSGGAAAVTPA